MFTVRAVVFDFDGVIANSEPLHFRAFRDVLAPEGVTLAEAEYYQQYLGYNDERAFVEIARSRGRSWNAATIAGLIARKAAITEELERAGSILFDGARHVIERLAAACPLAIASGALGSEIRRTLAREGLTHHFKVIVSADEGVASKPAPDPYLRAVRSLSETLPQAVPLAAGACAAIEDSPWGLESARAAGLRTVAITHTYPAAALAAADLVVEHLDDLTWELLCSLNVQSDGARSS